MPFLMEGYAHRKIPICTALESLPEVGGSNVSISADSLTPVRSSTCRGHQNFVSDVSEFL